jgi:UDP-glucose:(glucosyl)LPS alpha-1,2-glucosyltransferase
MPTPPRRVAVVLPPREGFGPQSAGAIGLLQERLARADIATPSPFTATILGSQSSGTLFDLPYVAVPPRLWPLGTDARYAAGVAQALERIRPALVEVHNRPDLAARLARRMPPQHIALFLHNDPRSMRGAGTARLRTALSAKLGRVVCVSNYLAGCWMQGVTGVAAPGVLPNCLDLVRLPEPLPPDARAQTILFTGRLVADKGADSFVAACARALPALPGWRAEMIGADRFRPDSPETPFTTALRQKAEAAGVTLLGYQDHGAVMAALGRAAIAVLPSRWQEPFGLAALEAMASGAALVTTARGGLADLTEGVAVTIDPEDPAAIARAIVALAEDTDRRASLAAAARRRAEEYDVPGARRLLDQLRMDILTP